ncbi:MAG: DNA repair protein RecO [Pseudomonadota bacterium]
MTRETVALQPAYVLHQRAFRDTSRIVDCLTPEHGRVALVARGVQRPRSPLRAVLMPFAPLTLSWVRRGELGTLTAAESVGAPLSIAADAIMSGWYINELILRLVQSHDVQTEIFALYARTLNELCATVEPAMVLRPFEKSLLDLLGYGLALTTEEDGSTPVEPGQRYRYRTGRGPQRTGAGDGGPLVVSGEVLLNMAADRFDDPATVSASRSILSAALNEQLGGRELRVRDVARDMQRVRQDPAQSLSQGPRDSQNQDGSGA